MPNIEPRLTAQTLKVLAALLDSTHDELPGAEIGQATNLPSGTLYPILIRLEYAGWLVSRWEAESPVQLGRPRKRFYRVTGLGLRKARSAFREFSPVIDKLGIA